ncbi:MAG: CHAT domain-containing protein, partial [Pyrinomonadaceae bacterium]
KALEFYNQVLPIYKAVGDRAGEANTLLNIGIVYNALGEKRKALEFYNQVLPIYKAVGDKAGEANTLYNIGNVYNALGEKQKALEFYDRALALFRASGDRGREALTLFNLGNIYSDSGENQKALDSYSQALLLFRALENRLGETTALYNIGNVYQSLSEPEKSLESFSQALPLYRALGDKGSEADTLIGIGNAYDSLGEYQKALDYFNQALTIQRALGDRGQEGGTLHSIGNVYSRWGEYQRALDYYNQALPLERAFGNRRTEAFTLIKIGEIYSGLGESEKALDFYTQALQLKRAMGDRFGEADALINIGALYSKLGVNQTALDFHTQALAIKRAVGDREGESRTLSSIGSLYFNLGEYQKALDYYNQALTLARTIGDRADEATTLNNIGSAYSRLGEKQKALDYYNQALTLARTIGDRAGEATTLNNIGFVYSLLGEKQKAFDYYSHALPVERAVGDRRGEARTLGNFMILSSERNKPALAIFYGKQAINIYQQFRGNIQGLAKEIQKTYLQTMEGSYRRLADILLSQGRLSEAQQTLNLFKDQQSFDFDRDPRKQASLLTLTPRESLMLKRYEQAADRFGTIAQKVTELKRSIAKGQPTPDQAAQLQQSDVELKGAADEFRGFLRQVENEFALATADKDRIAETADTRELQTALRELNEQTGQKAVAVYTLVGDDSFRALAVNADSITAAAQPIKGDSLNQKALQLWGLLQSERYDPKPLAQAVYTDVFKPIEARLPKDTATILWSLDGNLRYLPMSALHDGKQYLVERYNHVVFTRADRERMLRAVSPRWTGLGLGSSEAQTVEVLGDKISFSALPGVRAELHALFRQKGAAGGVLDGEVLPDARFTRAAMLAALKQKRPLVHISSHFSFRPGDEARSFLLLGDGTAMTLEEMKQQLDLFAGVELLTLSAC